MRVRQLALLVCAFVGVGGNALFAAPTPPGATAPAAVGTKAPSDSTADSKALADLESSLTPYLAAKDFPARLDKAADSLRPDDAASLYEFFAPRLAQGDFQARAYSRAADLRILLDEFGPAASDLENAGQAGSANSGSMSLRIARLWLGAGEAEMAGRLASTVLSVSKDPMLVDSARLVAAWAALLSGNTASASALAGTLASPPQAGSASDPARDAIRREALFMQWIAGDGTARDQAAKTLGALWPSSPEARIAKGGGRVVLMALPHWYLAGVGIQPAAQMPLIGTSGPSAQKPVSPDETSTEASSTITASPGTTASQSSETSKDQYLRYQVGSFAKMENAQALVDELNKKGFVSKIEVHGSGDQARESVVLSTKDNGDKLVEKLKDAGYEAWLLVD